MKFRNNNRKGQVAVEFLMTYGWMLLIVLIVGALVFSFVDFGGLLPNSLNFDKSFRGDASQMNVISNSDGGEMLIVLDYVGTSGRIQIDPEGIKFIPDGAIGAVCGSANTGNDSRSGIRTFTMSSINSIFSDGKTRGNVTLIAPNDVLQLSRGDGLVVDIECPSTNSPIISGNSIEGIVEVKYIDIRTKVEHTTEGVLRASVN